MSLVTDMHEDHKARRARLWGRPTPRPPAPAAPKLVLDIEAKRQADLSAAADLIDRIERAKRDKENSGPHWSRIVSEVAKKHGLHSRDLLSGARVKHIVMARYEAFYRMRTEILIGGLPMSYPAIGRRFGGMDHSSVLNGYRKHLASIQMAVTNGDCLTSLVDAELEPECMKDHHVSRRVVQ